MKSLYNWEVSKFRASSLWPIPQSVTFLVDSIVFGGEYDVRVGWLVGFDGLNLGGSCMF